MAGQFCFTKYVFQNLFQKYSNNSLHTIPEFGYFFLKMKIKAWI